MKGPAIQMPGSLMVIDPQGNMQPQYAALFASLAVTVFGGSRSGTSTERPTSEFQGRYVGMPYFDLSLGQPIFLKIASSNAWVKADGTPA